MTHQGFLGSLSTGALLVGAAVAILIALGGLLAFNGFPGESSDGSTETFSLGGEPARASTPGGAEASFELIDPEPGPVSATAGATPATAAPTTGAPGVSIPALPGAPSGPVSDGGNGGSVPIGPGPDRRVDTDGELGDPVRRVTQTVDGTLRRVSPSTGGVADLLQETTRPVPETLDRVGGTLGL